MEAVLASLRAPRFALRDALPTLPPQAGLYAIYGDDVAWAELRLGPAAADKPLYVGKAEDSFVSRDLKTHFADGRTGSSTVRRSLAALLRTKLALSGIPRNLRRPADFANFGLSQGDDAVLTAWMRERLQITVWPTDRSRALVDIETDVLRRWNPPLNIAKIDHDWRSFVKQERRVMADQARRWLPATE